MYTLKRILSLIAIGLCATHANAQYTPAIRSVRPGVTVGPNTVGKGILQFHLGGYKAWDGRRNDTSVYYNNATYFNAFVCYGITNRLEVNLLAETRNDKIDVNNIKTPASGVSLTAVGLRYTIEEGDANSPSIGLQGLIKLKGQASDYQPRNIATRALLLLGYEPTYIVSMSANLGLDYSGNNTGATGLYSFKTNVRLAPQLGSYIETYGTYSNRYVYNHIGLGMYYFITNDWQVDVSTGFGIRKNQYEGYMSLGIAFRIPTLGIPQQTQYADYSE